MLLITTSISPYLNLALAYRPLSFSRGVKRAGLARLGLARLSPRNKPVSLFNPRVIFYQPGQFKFFFTFHVLKILF